jgi:DNA uptake protein ComE-like DNA-binding protein
VGPQTAERIIAYREQQGRLQNMRQLRQADAVSVVVARAIRDLVRF